MKLSVVVCGFGSALVLALSSPDTARGQQPQTVVRYTFAGASGSPTTTASGVTGGEFVRDSSANTFYDNTAGNPAPDANSKGWTTSATVDLALYYTFTVTPTASGTSWNGFMMDLANFDAASINDGPTRFALRSSLDGFTTNLLTGVVSVGFTTDAVALNVTSRVPVEYRIYGYGAGTTGGLLQVDNVALTFAPAVPEPSTAVACGLAVLLGGLMFVRSRH